MKTYIFERVDGGVVVMRTNGDPAEEASRWPQKQKAEITGVIREVSEDAIPKDRAFRNAWKANGNRIEHDMEKCREIHRNKMRAARKPKLEALDTQYMLADEMSDALKKQQVAAKKKELRDVTAIPEIDQAATVEDLKAVWPDCLK